MEQPNETRTYQVIVRYLPWIKKNGTLEHFRDEKNTHIDVEKIIWEIIYGLLWILVNLWV